MAQVCARLDAFEQREVQVWVLTFGDRSSWIERWLEETCDLLPLIQDTERELYAALGLQRSWLRAWSRGTLWMYFKYWVTGRSLRGIRGDSAQLGGDFVVDPQAKLRWAYRSEDPRDRPTVDQILRVLDDLN